MPYNLGEAVFEMIMKLFILVYCLIALNFASALKKILTHFLAYKSVPAMPSM